MSQSASISSIASLEATMDKLPIHVWQMSFACTYGRVNAVHAAFLGKTQAEIEGQPIEIILPSADAAAAITQTRNAFEARQPIASEQWRTDAAGNRRLLYIYMAPVIDEAGKIQYLSCYADDITEQKEAVSALQHCQETSEDQITTKVTEAVEAIWGTTSSLVHQAETQDEKSSQHLKRLAESCRVVASVLSFNSVYSHNLNYDFIFKLQQACLFHDIGKVDIPESILLKPGKLTREEFEEVKKHTINGAAALERAYPRLPKSSIYLMAIDIALSHHERWDGKGYPHGLKGDEIPLSAQIVAICDTYDALRSERPYKPALSHEESMLELRKERGTQFNPVLCDAFFHSAEEIRHIFDKSAG